MSARPGHLPIGSSIGTGLWPLVGGPDQMLQLLQLDSAARRRGISANGGERCGWET